MMLAGAHLQQQARAAVSSAHAHSSSHLSRTPPQQQHVCGQCSRPASAPPAAAAAAPQARASIVTAEAPTTAHPAAVTQPHLQPVVVPGEPSSSSNEPADPQTSHRSSTAAQRRRRQPQQQLQQEQQNDGSSSAQLPPPQAALQPSLVPPRPWADAALQAVAAAGEAPGGSLSNSVGSRAAGEGASAPFVAAILSKQQQQQQQPQRTAAAAGGSGSEVWSDDFVSGVLAAVAAVTERSPAAAAAAASAAAVAQLEEGSISSSSAAAASGSSTVGGSSSSSSPAQQQRWDGSTLSPEGVEQQQLQEQQQEQGLLGEPGLWDDLVEPSQQQQQQQRPQAPRGEGLLTDARMQMLLSMLLPGGSAATADTDGGHHTQQAQQPTQTPPPAAQQWANAPSSIDSSSRSGRYSPSPRAASASAGWGYSSTTAVAPRLQRAQWLVEEIHRLQHTLAMTMTAAAAAQHTGISSSPAASQPARDSSAQHPAAEHQHPQQPHVQDQHHQHHQQQLAVIHDLQLQVHRLLLAHVSQDAASWRCILRVVEDFGAFLTPQLAAGALHSLQVMYTDGSSRRPVGDSDRGRAARLVAHLLGLVGQWHNRLGPKEVVSVLWTLVRLKPIRHLKLQQHMRLRDALVFQYQQQLRTQHWQLQQLARSRRHRSSSSSSSSSTRQHNGQVEQQQQQHDVVQQLPVLTHAAVLLACARLGLPAHRQLEAGTCSLVCQVALQQLLAMKQQLRHHQQQQDQQHHPAGTASAAAAAAAQAQRLRQKAALLASHIALLLYALSELGLQPHSSLLRSTWRFTRGLLQDMAPADVAMMAVAFGRFAAVPNKWWRNAFIRVTAGAANSVAAAAAVTAADAADAAAASQLPLNPADITSMLTAAHSMNLAPPAYWVAALFEASLAQLQRFSLFQCTVLLLALSRLRVQPQLQWLVAVTAHAISLTGGSVAGSAAAAAATDLLDTSSNGSSELGMQQPAAPVAQQQQQQQRLVALGRQQVAVLQPPASWAHTASLQQQQQQHLQALRNQQQPPGEQGPQGRVRRVHQPDKSRLCLHLLALSRAVALLPEAERDAAALQLQPLVAAAARQVAASLDRLQPLDLVQLLLGLQGLRCRPGPAFMAGFAARCEAVQMGFSPSLYAQLKVGYVGLGLTPPRSLLALMVAALSHHDDDT